MSIKVLFQVEVEFIDNGSESPSKDAALEAALTSAFETENDQGNFNFSLPITGLDGPVPYIPGGLMLQYDDISEAIKADAKIQAIIKEHGFLVIETD